MVVENSDHMSVVRHSLDPLARCFGCYCSSVRDDIIFCC